MATLQSRLDAFKKAFESGAPPYRVTPAVVEKMHRGTAELKALGVDKRALRAGARAPSFSLLNQDHVLISSNDLLREGPLIISFFRGHW
jgi:hypothetical protein